MPDAERPDGRRALGDDEARGILNSLLGDLPGVVYRCRPDRTWTMLALTRNVEELTGWTAEELLETDGPSWRTLLHPEDRPRVDQQVRKALEDRRSFRSVYRIRDKAGELRWVLEQGSPVDEDGRTILTGYVQEVSGPWIERLAEVGRELEEVRRETRQLQLLQAVTQIANRERSFESALSAAVEEVCRLLSFPVGHVFLLDEEEGLRSSGLWSLDEGVAGLDRFVEATESHDWDPARGLPGRVVATGRSEWMEDLPRSPDCRRVSSDSDSPIRSGVAVPVISEARVVAVLEFYSHRRLEPEPDVAERLEQIGVQLGRVWEREQADRSEHMSQQLFRQLLERRDLVFWTSDPDGRLLYVSPGLETLFGLDEGKTLAITHWRDLLEVAHPDDRERLGAVLSDPDRAPYDVEYRVVTTDGGVRWIHQRAFPMEDEAGAFVRLGGLAEDVTEARRSGTRLEETTRLLEQTFSSLEEAVFVIERDGPGARRVVEMNPAAERIFGWSRAEMLGETTLKVHPDHASYERFSREGDPHLEENGVFHASFPLQRKDGTVFEAEQTVTLLDPARGLEGGVVSVVRDVSHRVELERQLGQAQKMEAVGRLAGGIAHDFNNLLTVIRAQVDFFLLDLPADGSMAEELFVIREAADRAAELTRQLLAFSREQVLRPRVVDLNEIVVGMMQLLRRVLGEDMDIHADLATDLPAIRVDRGQLEQVIMNLAVNARDAMPSGGRLVLTTEAGEPTAEQAGYLPGEEVSEVVRLYVSDTGHGMDEATREHVFEPFFTTKGEEGGTGLGLSMSYGIVKQSGGAITVESELGRGTTFTLCFRPTEAASREGAGRRRPEETRDAGLTGTILVVEDDASVLRVARKILERAGLRVRTASDTASARAALEEEGSDIDLLLTDLVLPGAGGRSLVELVMDELPHLPVVVMSGYAEGSPGKRVDLPDSVGFIQKPFTPDGLVETLRRHLGR